MTGVVRWCGQQNSVTAERRCVKRSPGGEPCAALVARRTRYRAARGQNRRRQSGWLPPSLSSRLHNVLTWVQPLCHFCTIGALSLELVRFDPALLQNPSLEGIAYQRGTLFGAEQRQYL